MPENSTDPSASLYPHQRPIITVAVASGKGGVGKTNVSVNLAMAAALDGLQVMLLDADLGLGNVDILLGVDVHRNLSHVLSGECGLDDITIRGPEGVVVIPAGSGITELTRLSDGDRASLISAFGAIQQDVDLLVVDTEAGISDNVSMLSRAAQEVILVVCDEPTSIADAYALTKVLSKEHGVRRFQVVTNMVNDATHGRNLFGSFAGVVDQFLDVELGFLGMIPRDRYLLEAVRQQQAVVLAYPVSKSGLALRKLARSLLRLDVDRNASGGMQFFLERLVQGRS